MFRLRRLLLLFAPLPIISVSWGITHWARGERTAEPQPNHVVAAELSPRVASQIVADVDPSHTEHLLAGCRAQAESLQRQLNSGCHVIVRAPFVIAGDLSVEQLETWHERTIGPATKALAHCYFDTPPDAPITILLFSGEASYNRYAKLLFGDEGISVYGYYRPHLRTLVMNIGTGGGTLVHELTHALAAFDYPEMPDWFNEGLASLHEACQIRDDGAGLTGLVNWRLAGLQETIRAGDMPSLRELTRRKDFRGSQVGLNYAQARYLCLFLQERELLKTFYHRSKQARQRDPNGHDTLLSLFPDYDWERLDREFRAFVLELKSTN